MILRDRLVAMVLVLGLVLGAFPLLAEDSSTSTTSSSANPYLAQAQQAYNDALKAYQNLMRAYQYYPGSYSAIVYYHYRYAVAYYRYQVVVRQYWQWERTHTTPPDTGLSTLRVRIEREMVYQPAVVPEPIEYGLITDDQARSVELKVGQRVSFQVLTNASTGYSWSGKFSVDGVATLSEQPITETYTADDRVGQSTIASYRVEAQAIGRTELTMTYARSWETTSPARTFKLTVVVTGSSSTSGRYLAIQNPSSRSRITYKVSTQTESLVRRWVSHEVWLTGRFVRDTNAYSGTVQAVSVRPVYAYNQPSDAGTGSNPDYDGVNVR